MKIAPEGYIDYEIPRPSGLRYNNEQQQYMPREEYEEEDDGMYQRPQYPEPSGAVFPGQDQGFLKWLFDFRKEAITPLRNVWRGKEYDFNNNTWSKEVLNQRIMNEKGITWGISLIESYMNPAFIVTDLDETTYTFRMREVVRVIWNSLSLRYQEFELKKSDIHRVAEEIESKVSAILRGALDNGYRDFFSTQNQTIETKNLTPTPMQPRPSIWSKTAQFLKTHNNQGQI